MASDRRVRLARVGAGAVLAVIALASILGTVGEGGLSSPWLWIGLGLVPVLLWLVREAGWHR